MNQTMKRTPIEFTFGFLTEKTEYDYTNDWKGLGMPEFGEKSCNKKYKYLQPISGHGLLGKEIEVSFIGDDFIFYDEETNLIKDEQFDDDEFEFGEVVYIREYKDNCALRNAFKGNEPYFIDQLKLDQTIFDVETWLLENLNSSFVFVLGITTERQINCGDWAGNNEDDAYWVDGFSHVQPMPYASFSDIGDAMAYKLRFL